MIFWGFDDDTGELIGMSWEEGSWTSVRVTDCSEERIQICISPTKNIACMVRGTHHKDMTRLQDFESKRSKETAASRA